MIDPESPFPVQPYYSDLRGDGFAASRDLNPNELILRVAPVAAVPKDSHITSVCASCFRRGSRGGPAVVPHGELEVVRISHRHAHGGGGDHNGKGSGHHAADSRGGGGESDNHAHEGGVDLLLCIKCHAASFCARCRASAWVVAKHAEECSALGALIGMRRTRTEAEEGRRLRRAGEETIRPGPSRSSADINTAPPPSSSTAAAAAVRGDDTTTLRLVLSLACFVARARRKATTSRCDMATYRLPSRSLGS